MLWREQVRDDVIKVLRTWKGEVTTMTDADIPAIAADIADCIATPDTPSYQWLALWYAVVICACCSLFSAMGIWQISKHLGINI